MTPVLRPNALIRLQRVLHGLVLALCVLAALLACVELAGWGLGKALLVPGSGRMVPNTAVGLLGGALALALLHSPRARRWRRWGQALAALPLLVGLLTLVQYGFAVALGADALLFPEAVERLEVRPSGRPTPATAFNLCLIGLALVLLEVESREGRRPAQYLALGTWILAMQVLLRYVYLEEQVSSPGTHFLPMALPTALACLALSSGILLARPERGMMAVVLRDSVGGLMARRLIPAALLIPILAGWLRLLGERLGFYETAFGVSLIVVFTILGLLFILMRNAQALHELDIRRLQAEQSLRVSEARLAGIISSAGEAIISVDDSQRITLFNESAERIFGYPASEVLGNPLELLLPELQRAPHWQHVQRFATGFASSQQMGRDRSVRGLRKTGEEFTAEATVSRLEVEGRWLFTAIVRDMTERQRVEEALRESQERFRTAYEDAPIGMALVRLDGRFLNVNRSLCEIVGYAPQELLSKTFQDITYPEDLEKDLANARRLLQGEISSYQLEKRYIHKQGRLVTILLTGSLVRDLRAEPAYFIAQIQDITERKRLEQAWRFLAEAGPRLADSLDPQTTLALVAGVVVPSLADWCVVELVDEQGRVVMAECKTVSAEKEKALRAFLNRSSRDLERHGSIVTQVIRTGEPLLMAEVPGAVLEAAAEDAEHLEILRGLNPLSGLIVPLRAHGRTLGTLVLATSESGRRYDTGDMSLAMELARRAALAIDNARLYRQSEDATRIRDQVLRIVAHDLRTPLQTILLCASYVLKRLPADRAEDRKPLETIKRAVSSGNRLIEDLLDVARIESGNLVMDRQAQPLAALVEAALDLHGTLAEEKGLQLLATLPEACPLLWVDRDRILQVLSNLLGNAIKFTPKGGRITVRAQPLGDKVCLSVTDTGPGIDAEHLPHLFTAFWQVHRGDKNGAGLGLAIALGIIEAHGGKLWVESQPGQGTAFFFTLPTVGPEKKKGPGD